MNIGILCSEFDISKMYRDTLSEFGDVYLFDDASGFVCIADTFDFIVIDHRVNGKPWLSIYTKIPEGKPVLVLATYSPQYYKAEFPDSLYLDLQPIMTMKGVYFAKKDDLETIKFYTEVESLKKTCKTLVKSLSYR